MVNSNKVKEIRNSIYSGSFDPYQSYRSGQSLAKAGIPPEELGIDTLVRNFDLGINSMSFDNRASFEVGKTICNVLGAIGRASLYVIDKFSEAVKNVYELNCGKKH